MRRFYSLRSGMRQSYPVLYHGLESASDSTDYDFIDARLQADMTLMQAELSKENGTLTFTLTTPEYMEKETAEKLKPFLRRSIVYTWKDGKFIPDTL